MIQVVPIELHQWGSLTILRLPVCEPPVCAYCRPRFCDTLDAQYSWNICPIDNTNCYDLTER